MLSRWNHHARVRESFEASLENLGTHIDLVCTNKIIDSKYSNGWVVFDALAAMPSLWWQASRHKNHTYTDLELDIGKDEPMDPDAAYTVTNDITFKQSWAEMEKLLDTGKVRAIGVSNFSIKKSVFAYVFMSVLLIYS